MINIFSSPSNLTFLINNHSDGIDLYLYPSHVAHDNGGMANGVGSSGELYIAGTSPNLPISPYIQAHVISHEKGHGLMLMAYSSWYTIRRRTITM